MRKLKFAFAAALAVGSLAGRAATTNVCYLLKPADYAIIDWTNDANYDATQGAVPSGGGFLDVRVPDGAKIVVDDAAMDQIKDFFVIKPGKNGELILSNTVDKTLNVAFYDRGTGWIDPNASQLVIKRGAGTVTLGSDNRFLKNGGNRMLDYGVSWTIDEGRINFPSRTQSNNGSRMMVGNIKLTTETSTLGIAYRGDEISIGTLTGIGEVTSVSDSTYEHLSVRSACTFGGRFTGRTSLEADGSSVMLTNVTSTGSCASSWGYDFSAVSGGTLGLASFGLKGQASAAGSGSEILINSGGRLLFLGSQDTTDKSFRLRVDGGSKLDRPFVFDGGASGGLTFTTAANWEFANNGERQLVLQGDGATPCVMRGSIDITQNKGLGDAIAKKGAGTWAFERNRSYTGAWYVQDGVLAFDSLDEAGTCCALGYANRLTTLLPSTRTTTTYAFELGGTDGKVPMLAFTGTNMTWCSTRPVALVGSGGFRNDSECDFRFDGVTSVSGGAKDLVLDGSNANGSEIAGIADTADEAVSIVKTGTGTWTLNGSNTLHGAIRVRAGTLKVRRDPARYTWYKFVAKGPAVESSQTFMTIGELGLYNGESRNLALGVQFGGVGAKTLHPGWCCLPRRGAINTGNDSSTYLGTPARLFDGGTAGLNNWEVSYNLPEYADRWDLTAVYLSFSAPYRETAQHAKPATWIPLVIRLTNTADIVKYDLARRFEGDGPGRVISYWSLAGSVDGMHWDELSDVTNTKNDFGGNEATGGYWGSDDKAVNGDIKVRSAACYPIASGPATAPAFTVMDNVTSVSVAAGAQFLCEGEAPTVKGLVIDASGAGLVSNVAFAASGTLEVTNVNTRVAAVTLPGIYADAANLANVGGWSLTVNGSASMGHHYNVLVRDGAITLKKKGLVLFLK